MALDTVGVLLDQPATAEAVRDRVASLLVANFAEQRALATAAGQPPEEFDAYVFTERSSPWELARAGDQTPIVNVSLDNASYQGDRSPGANHQHAEQRINIDCVAFGVNEQTADGHDPGDYLASLEAARVTRQVRSMLMSPGNIVLQLRGTVHKRWIESTQMLQPPAQGGTFHVVASRLTLVVWFLESAPVPDPTLLEIVYSEFDRATDGKITLAVQYGE